MALDFNKLKSAEDAILAYLQENNPELDLSRGTGLRDTLVKLAASGLALFRSEAKLAKESFSLKRILEGLGDDVDTTDTSIVDNAVSNYFVTRKVGDLATGFLKVTVVRSKEYLIPNSFIWRIDTEAYFTIGQVNISPEITTGVKALYPTSGGKFFFLVPIIASSVGSEFNKVAGVAAEADNLDPSVSTVVTYDDITGGLDEETNSELVARAQQAITVRDLNTRKSIPFVLKENFLFLRKVIAIGYGDPEMQRDVLHSPTSIIVSNVHFGGNIDVWVRTSEDPEIKVITKVVDPSGQVVLSAPDTPLYRVFSVSTSADVPILDDLDFTYSADGNVNHRAESLINARFSQFEILTISGLDAYIGQDVRIRVTRPEKISELQAFVDSEDNRVIACVSVVRGLIPVFIEMTVAYKSLDGEAIDEVGLAKEIAAYVNDVDPNKDLKTSEIAAIAQRFSNVDSIQLPITLRVTIEVPDGTTDTFTTDNIVDIPSRPEVCLTNRTVAYFCDPNAGISFSKIN